MAIGMAIDVAIDVAIYLGIHMATYMAIGMSTEMTLGMAVDMQRECYRYVLNATERSHDGQTVMSNSNAPAFSSSQ